MFINGIVCIQMCYIMVIKNITSFVLYGYNKLIEIYRLRSFSIIVFTHLNMQYVN